MYRLSKYKIKAATCDMRPWAFTVASVAKWYYIIIIIICIFPTEVLLMFNANQVIIQVTLCLCFFFKYCLNCTLRFVLGSMPPWVNNVCFLDLCVSGVVILSGVR